MVILQRMKRISIRKIIRHMGFVKNITYINDPMWFQFFVFVDADSAVGAYQSLSSNMSTMNESIIIVALKRMDIEQILCIEH